MRLGLSISLNRSRPGGAAGPLPDPYESITVQGSYDSVENAVAGGLGASEYFVTSIDNIYGLPGFVLMRNTPYTGYDSPTAGQNAVGSNVVFQLQAGNSLGYPAGACIIVGPQDEYINDVSASAGGVSVNELYALETPNLGKLIKQRTQ